MIYLFLYGLICVYSSLQAMHLDLPAQQGQTVMCFEKNEQESNQHFVIFRVRNSYPEFIKQQNKNKRYGPVVSFALKHNNANEELLHLDAENNLYNGQTKKFLDELYKIKKISHQVNNATGFLTFVNRLQTSYLITQQYNKFNPFIVAYISKFLNNTDLSCIK